MAQLVKLRCMRTGAGGLNVGEVAGYRPDIARTMLATAPGSWERVVAPPSLGLAPPDELEQSVGGDEAPARTKRRQRRGTE